MKKWSSLLGYQRSANQNSNVTSHLSKWVKLKSQMIQSIGRMWNKYNPVYCLWDYKPKVSMKDEHIQPWYNPANFTAMIYNGNAFIYNGNAFTYNGNAFTYNGNAFIYNGNAFTCSSKSTWSVCCHTSPQAASYWKLLKCLSMSTL